MKNIGSIASFIADLLGISAFIGLLLLIFCDHDIPSHLNIHSFLVGVLSVIVTLLVTWNIYSMFDVKAVKKDMEIKIKKIDRELNYAHNKMDDYEADTNAFLSQISAALFSKDSDVKIKELSLLHGVSALCVYSKLPGDEIKAQNMVYIINDLLDRTKHLKLDSDFIYQLILRCGSINNQDKIVGFSDMITKIRACE